MSKPSEFPTVQLEDVVEVLDHLRVPVNSAERLGRTGVVPYYGANGLQGWIDKPLFDEPLILLAEDGGNFEDFASRPIAYRIEGPSWVNNHAHIIRAKAGICQSYIFWSLVNKDIRRFIAGGTRTKLTQGELRRIEISLPDAKEQRAIAQVLDTLDTAIRETEALIDKLKAVKQGLLHDLLTRGIDVNGQLRRPESEAPQLYKESPLGWIPKEWEIRQVQELGEAITGSTPPSVDPLAWGQGIPFITPGDIEDDRPISFVERQVSPRGQKYVRLLPAGSSLVVCIGSTIGKVGMTSAVACTNQQVNAVVPGNGTDSVFLFHALQMHAGQLRALAGLQAVPIVNKSSFESIMLPSPFYEEQVGISARVSAISNRLNSEAEHLEKLRQQKIGLMDDLLTGRVRVTPLLESV